MKNAPEDAVTIQYCKQCNWFTTQYPVAPEDKEVFQPNGCHGDNLCPSCESMDFGQRKAGFWGQFVSLFLRDF